MRQRALYTLGPPQCHQLLRVTRGPYLRVPHTDTPIVHTSAPASVGVPPRRRHPAPMSSYPIKNTTEMRRPKIYTLLTYYERASSKKMLCSSGRGVRGERWRERSGGEMCNERYNLGENSPGNQGSCQRCKKVEERFILTIKGKSMREYSPWFGRQCQEAEGVEKIQREENQYRYSRVRNEYINMTESRKL